jgi:hypothetical protein
MGAHHPLRKRNENKGYKVEGVQSGKSKDREIPCTHKPSLNGSTVKPKEHKTRKSKKEFNRLPAIFIEELKKRVKRLAPLLKGQSPSSLEKKVLPMPEHHGESGQPSRHVEGVEPPGNH